MRPAVFLDRDGTLMEETEYCGDPARVRVFPEVAETLTRLRERDFLLIVITNQSGIGRGYFTERDFWAVQAELERQIRPAYFDGVYFCAEAESPRRKPAPGMLLEAARDHGIDLAQSYMVGDRASDIEAGRAAGCRTVLVLTGYGRQHQGCGADFTAESFALASRLLAGE